MLTFFNQARRNFCDRVQRRDFLKVGALGIGGLTLADLLRLEASAKDAGQTSRTKSIINIHLPGGPSHQDMWDLKPDAPSEYRGEFMPIKTNSPGLEICQMFPALATMADKFSTLRAVVGSVNEHSPSTSQTGYGQKELKAIGGAPAVGSVISKLQGFNNGVAPFVSDGLTLSAGFLGPKYKPFSPTQAKSLLELKRIDAKRLSGRSELLKTVDGLKREMDASGQFAASDAFTQQAVDVVLSGKMAEALDLTKEDPETLTRYVGDRKGRLAQNDKFLRARRLVEAGVRCVSMSWGSWDTHSKNFVTFRDQLPAMDRGLSNLIKDLDDRGLLQDTAIVVWGEFGRTPRVNANAGRDHWPRVAAAFLAGGEFNHGQALGTSDRIAGEASERAIHIHEIHASLYHHMGIDPRTTQIIDPAGRPRYLLDTREPISELV